MHREENNKEVKKKRKKETSKIKPANQNFKTYDEI